MKKKNILIAVLLVAIVVVMFFMMKRKSEYFNTKNILYVMPDVKIDQYDSESIRTGGIGISGTHQSSIIIAEGLAK